MEELKLNTKTLCRISKALNKMGISRNIIDINVDTGNAEADKMEVGRKVVTLIIDNFYKAEDELIEIISLIKGISIEEAAELDVIPIIMALLENEKVKSFLASL